jgi:hypothetical protein
MENVLFAVTRLRRLASLSIVSGGTVNSRTRDPIHGRCAFNLQHQASQVIRRQVGNGNAG